MQIARFLVEHEKVDQRQALGISESLIRYSVGIENPEDLAADLEQALAGL